MIMISLVLPQVDKLFTMNIITRETQYPVCPLSDHAGDSSVSMGKEGNMDTEIMKNRQAL